MNASAIIYTQLADLVDGKCYPLIIPESEPSNQPYIVYQIISTEPDNTLDGITGHEWVTAQIDVYHSDYDACLSLTAKAINQLDQIKPSTYHGTQYLRDEESGLFRGLVEYSFWQTLEL